MLKIVNKKVQPITYTLRVPATKRRINCVTLKSCTVKQVPGQIQHDRRVIVDGFKLTHFAKTVDIFS